MEVRASCRLGEHSTHWATSLVCCSLCQHLSFELADISKTPSASLRTHSRSMCADLPLWAGRRHAELCLPFLLLVQWLVGKWPTKPFEPSPPHHFVVQPSLAPHVEGLRPMAYVIGHQFGARLTQAGRLIHVISGAGLVEVLSYLVDWESGEAKDILWTSATFFYKTGRPYLETRDP